MARFFDTMFFHVSDCLFSVTLCIGIRLIDTEMCAEAVNVWLLRVEYKHTHTHTTYGKILKLFNVSGANCTSTYIHPHRCMYRLVDKFSCAVQFQF